MEFYLLEEFRKVLESRKREIEEILARLRGELATPVEGDIWDEGDFAAFYQEQSREELLYAKLREELEEIERALGKIREGSYGICEMCEEEIELERLRVKPFARYCIECRRIVEQEHRKRS